jgi:hypothetical protein
MSLEYVVFRARYRDAERAAEALGYLRSQTLLVCDANVDTAVIGLDLTQFVLDPYTREALERRCPERFVRRHP